MEVLLTALNAKYVHTNLAVLYLKSAVPEYNIKIKEFTINEPTEFIISSIYQLKADIIAFSCYIWNIEKVMVIASALKKIKPEIKIVLGGPEVSYEVEDLLIRNEFIDFIIIGEGELAFAKLLLYLNKKEFDLEDIEGLAFRKDKGIRINDLGKGFSDWANGPSPFINTNLVDYYKGKSLYYESSRGCPFTCSYCLSGHHGLKVKFLPLARVKRELSILADSGAKQIKFVDRTFNCNKRRALEIWQYILDLKKGLNYHFEISADLLDEEIVEFLRKIPEGLFNFEIGIQTTQTETMEAIYRKSNIEQVFRIIRCLLKETKVKVYLDLIVGLPYETYEKFRESFDLVIGLNPHKLHMGFLKILKGSQIKREANFHGYKYYDNPPYELLENNYISFEEIAVLKRIEHILERYYNSGRFLRAHQFISRNVYNSLFVFYHDLSQYWTENGLFDRAVSLNECYDQLYDFLKKERPQFLERFSEILKFDYLLGNMKGNLPNWCGKFYTKLDRERHSRLVNNELFVEKYLPHLKDMSRKERINLTHSEEFTIDVSSESFVEKPNLVLFDYSRKIGNGYRYIVIPQSELDLFTDALT